MNRRHHIGTQRLRRKCSQWKKPRTLENGENVRHVLYKQKYMDVRGSGQNPTKGPVDSKLGTCVGGWK